MNKKFIKIKTGGEIEATFYEKSIIKDMKKLYEMWIAINEYSKSLEGRIINTPEALSEILACLLYKLGRTNNSRSKGNIKGKSMDAISKDGIKYQIKASSVDGGTLTSFSPNTNYDKLIFADFYAHGNWDGTIIFYTVKKFPQEMKVNSKETFDDQQRQGRRPRFNLLKKIKSREIKKISKTEINIYNFFS